MAPFKLRFSKMAKSRGKGSKSGVSRGNSVESDEPSQQQQQQQQRLNHSNLQTLAGTTSRPETPGTEAAAGFPDSPPPSYQHVLEETRLRRSTTNPEVEEDEIESNAEVERRRQERRESGTEERSEPRRNKILVIERSPNGAGGPGGSGGRTSARGPEIIHKSSKELYRAIAKEWGLTCKMTDQCRCFDCQSQYFDCEYEKDEHGKTDGGLGAGTPMFIAEVMHGTACVLL